jgi:tRNA dimethylallyltransferase
MARAPHHLYSVVDPSTNLDAARYRELAAPVIAGIGERGRLPIVVGGSGLYLKFLTHGPSPLPPADPAVRRELEQLSLEELNRRLAEADPQSAATIDRHNPRYVQRALEVCILTGRPVSELRTSFEKDPPSLRGLLVTRDLAELDVRIRQRTAAMLESGAIDEVSLLPALSRTARRAIGVPEIRALLAGNLDRRTCEERIAIATRQYAKRQRTWFRREKWLTSLPGDAAPDRILHAARALLGS